VQAPLLLITNDDGVHAEGLRALVEAAESLGEVIVAAPEGERSGTGHAMTFNTHLRVTKTSRGWWAVSGTPVDCVYFGLIHLCPRPPALVLSGINAGHNLGTDVFYSGTVGAAAEAYLRGVSAIAVSVDRGVDPAWAGPVVQRLAAAQIAAGGPAQLLNLNVPAAGPLRPTPDIIERASAQRAVAVTRLGRRDYHDAVEERVDPMGRPYYWIGGPPQHLHGHEGDDTYATSKGIASVTPLELDLTAPDASAARRLVTAADNLTLVTDAP
jgi:5'-nucleotidase